MMTKPSCAGPAAKIPEMVGLVTWRVAGPDLGALEEKLKTMAGVLQVARFGSVLHVSGTDKAALEGSIRQLEAEGTHDWSQQPAGLEEAFIYLMTGARDNFATDTPAAAA
jgi:ABC-2 type transport system ATP-binding protein